MNDIGTDGGGEDSGEGSGGGLFSAEGEDGKDGTGSHFVMGRWGVYLRSSDADRSVYTICSVDRLIDGLINCIENCKINQWKGRKSFR